MLIASPTSIRLAYTLSLLNAPFKYTNKHKQMSGKHLNAKICVSVCFFSRSARCSLTYLTRYRVVANRKGDKDKILFFYLENEEVKFVKKR